MFRRRFTPGVTRFSLCGCFKVSPAAICSLAIGWLGTEIVGRGHYVGWVVRHFLTARIRFMCDVQAALIDAFGRVDAHAINHLQIKPPLLDRFEVTVSQFVV